VSAPDVHELGIWNANNEVEVGKGHVIRPADVHVVDWPVGAAEQLHLPRVVILLGGSESRPGQAPSCHLRVRALLQAARWDQDPHSIAEQRTITDGRIVAIGKGFIRKRPKRVDYLLRYTRDFPLAVVEATRSRRQSRRRCRHSKYSGHGSSMAMRALTGRSQTASRPRKRSVAFI